MSNEISNERLERFIGGEHITYPDAMAMAKELLTLRMAPIPDEFLNAEQNSSGMFEISEDCMCKLMNMLCSKPESPEGRL